MHLHSRKGSTLVEITIVVAILAIGIISVYKLVFSGSILAHTTEDRVLAINLAREWIEIATNIRDTNWIKFSSDTKNCFDVKDYDERCIGGASIPAPQKLASIDEYVPVRNGSTVWYLTGITTTGSGVGYDANGGSAQGADMQGFVWIPCQGGIHTNCKTSNFFRTIKIKQGAQANGLDTLIVTSTVTWLDSDSRQKPYTITFEKTLTNWKQNFTNN